ncbi:variant-surface-glycoprotein phospholipase C, partial [Trypanosoma cruzi marinkellei]
MLSGSDEFTRTAWNPQSWMHDLRPLIGEKAITQVFLLGSHNAASYAINRGSPFAKDAPGILYENSVLGSMARFFSYSISAAWARCQGLSVRAQLDHGVRYLDLRVVTNPGDPSRLYISHAQISVPLAVVLEDVKAFLDNASSANEFIVLDFHHLFLTDDSDGQGKFFRELDRLSDRFIPVEVPLTTPLETLWRNSPEKRIFLVVAARRNLMLYPAARIRSRCMVSRWVDKCSLRELLQALTNLLQDDL